MFSSIKKKLSSATTDASFFSNLKFESCLGQGGFGTVLKAIDRNSSSSTQSRPATAVKFIFCSGSNAQEERQIIRETTLAINFNHKNIIKILAVERKQFNATEIKAILGPVAGKNNTRLLNQMDMYTSQAQRNPNKTVDCICIQMQLCGKNLRAWLSQELDKNDKMVQSTQIQICLGMASGLKYLHDNNIIHRDLKPENIVFSGEKFALPVKICDLGLCRTIHSPESHTSSLTSRIGTPEYMAPEIFTHDYSYQVDLFSLGLIIWEVFQLIKFAEKRKLFHRLVNCNEEDLVNQMAVIGVPEVVLGLTRRNMIDRTQSVNEIVTIFKSLSCREEYALLEQGEDADSTDNEKYAAIRCRMPEPEAWSETELRVFPVRPDVDKPLPKFKPDPSLQKRGGKANPENFMKPQIAKKSSFAPVRQDPAKKPLPQPKKISLPKISALTDLPKMSSRIDPPNLALSDSELLRSRLKNVAEKNIGIFESLRVSEDFRTRLENVASGEIVVVEEGLYEGEFILEQDNVEIVGAGSGTVFKGLINKTCLEIRGRGCTISDIKVISEEGSKNFGIHVLGSRNTIRNVEASRGKACFKVRAEGNRLENLTISDAENGIILAAGSRHIVDHVKIDNIRNVGITLNFNSDQNTISNVSAACAKFGIWVGGSSNNFVDIDLVRQKSSGESYGMYLASAASNTTISNLTCSGYFTDTNDRGLRIASSDAKVKDSNCGPIWLRGTNATFTTVDCGEKMKIDKNATGSKLTDCRGQELHLLVPREEVTITNCNFDKIINEMALLDWK